jgi:hypothetical protein
MPRRTYPVPGAGGVLYGRLETCTHSKKIRFLGCFRRLRAPLAASANFPIPSLYRRIAIVFKFLGVPRSFSDINEAHQLFRVSLSARPRNKSGDNEPERAVVLTFPPRFSPGALTLCLSGLSVFGPDLLNDIFLH